MFLLVSGLSWDCMKFWLMLFVMVMLRILLRSFVFVVFLCLIGWFGRFRMRVVVFFSSFVW